MYDFKIKGEHENDTKHRDQLIRDMIYVCCLPGLSKKSRKEFLDKAISWPFSDKAEHDIDKSAKLKGCKYWSSKALAILIKFNEDKKSGRETKSLESQLRHEHVVPRNILIKAMEDYFDCKQNEIKHIETEAEIQELYNNIFSDLQPLMKNNILGCVVTKTEAEMIDGKNSKKEEEFKKRMPQEAYSLNDFPQNDFEFFSKIINPWARYTRIKENITIKELSWENKALGWGDYTIVNEDFLSNK